MTKIPQFEARALNCLDRLPPCSPILSRLMASLGREEATFAEFAELIERDTVLAGNVLRLVNSPIYGLRGTVTSVRHAVAILGVNKLRNVVLGMSVARLWRTLVVPPGFSLAAFNLHSAATGLLSDTLVQLVPAPYPEGAFVAGLLHDIGKLLIAMGLPGEYERIVKHAEAGESLFNCESEILGTTHAQLSAAALRKWNVPEPIRCAVEFHHNPAEAGGGLHLSQVIEAADLIAADLGYFVPPGPDKTRLPAILEAFGTGDVLAGLVEKAKQEFEDIRQLF